MLQSEYQIGPVPRPHLGPGNEVNTKLANPGMFIPASCRLSISCGIWLACSCGSTCKMQVFETRTHDIQEAL